MEAKENFQKGKENKIHWICTAYLLIIMPYETMTYKWFCVYHFEIKKINATEKAKFTLKDEKYEFVIYYFYKRYHILETLVKILRIVFDSTSQFTSFIHDLLKLCLCSVLQ